MLLSFTLLLPGPPILEIAAAGPAQVPREISLGIVFRYGASVARSKKSVIVPNGGAAWLGSALLLGALLAAYGNHFHNGFHMDDGHTIVDNPAIRELRNVPLFFRDAATFSALPSNQSYRPLQSTLPAIDSRPGHGLEPFWFQLPAFLLFGALVLLLAFYVQHLLARDATASAPRAWIAFAGAAWYGLNPANADTVHYIIAS